MNTTNDIITRAEAKALGLKRFFTGKPCQEGHEAPRYVSNGVCVTCTYERKRVYERKLVAAKEQGELDRYAVACMDFPEFSHLPRTSNEARKSGSLHYFPARPCARGHVAPHLTSTQGCIPCARAVAKAYYANNVSAQRQYHREWRRAYRAANPDEAREYARTYAAANPEKARARSARRRARKLAATPANETAADRRMIQSVYDEVPIIEMLLGEPCAVDHIIALANGGLHVYENLTVMTARENLSKGARADWKPGKGVFHRVTYTTFRQAA